jgi:hypothetical protein
MATQPDQIREEIENTRSELAADVDRLADRTSPKRIAERRLGGIKSAVRRTTDRVMGASQEAGTSMTSGMSSAQERVQGAAHTVADTTQSAAQTVAGKAQDAASGIADAARQAPGAVTRRTQGNPIAVGLIAFGAGLLAASLLPETEAERRAGERLAEQAGGAVEPLKEKAQELGSDLKDRAREAAGEIKDTAGQAVAATREQATQAGRDAAQQTKESVTSKR